MNTCAAGCHSVAEQLVSSHQPLYSDRLQTCSAYYVVVQLPAQLPAGCGIIIVVQHQCCACTCSAAIVSGLIEQQRRQGCVLASIQVHVGLCRLVHIVGCTAVLLAVLVGVAAR
jgi:predicted short-subunit dehydrogenase-like oxidoreductase (DUF2520 family)